MFALFVYMTAASSDEAQKIAHSLVEQRLVACANIMSPHRAVYWWEGEVQSGEEVAVIFKTRAALFDQVRDAILALHSYDCPCIVALPIEKGHEPFLSWIEAETNI